MPLEIEKKYRLTSDERAALLKKLSETGAEPRGGEEFEVNTLYTGPGLDPARQVLRLRRVGGRAVFTYKERFASESAVKRHREDETEVSDADALASILDALGYRPALLYEKRRATWHVAGAEVVLDELPFGLFVEIEGDEDSIHEAERLLELTATEAVHESYPELTRRLGAKRGDVIEARFPDVESQDS